MDDAVAASSARTDPAGNNAGGKEPDTHAVTHRSVLAIAVPMTLAFMTTPLLGFVDTTVIGRLGDATLLGGIAVGAVIFSILFNVFNFLRMGTTGLTAQASSAGNGEEVGAILLRTLLIGIVAGLAMIALGDSVLALALRYVDASPDVAAATTQYFDARIYSAPFSLCNFALLGWFLGRGRSGIGLALQTLLNGTNIVLSIWFVMGLGWGVSGVALATVLGEAVATIAGVALVLRQYGRSVATPFARIFDRTAFIRLVSINRDIMVRSMALILAYSFFTAQSAGQTTLILAANAVLLNFVTVAGHFLDGFAAAAEQLVGSAIGRRSRAMVNRAVKLTVLWGFGLGVAASLVLWSLGTFIIDFVTTSPDVRETAREYLIWAALTPIAGAVAFEFDGVFIGATWGRDMRNMMLVSLGISALVWWIAMPVWGNHGLWLAMIVFFSARGLTLMARYPACLERTLPAGGGAHRA